MLQIVVFNTWKGFLKKKKRVIIIPPLLSLIPARESELYPHPTPGNLGTGKPGRDETKAIIHSTNLP